MSPETPLAPGIWRMTSNLDEDDGPYEGRWPIPHGLALHCYVVQGSQTVVIDPYHEGEYGVDEVAEDLEVLGLSWGQVTAVLFTSADPGLTWPVPVVALGLGERHELGAGKTLVRTEAGLWEPSTGVLFSGPLGAGFGAVEETVLATEANGTETVFYEDEALRWWLTHPESRASIPEECRFVAPAHGLLWPHPETLNARLQDWAGWDGPAEEEVTLVWSDRPTEDDRVFDLISGLQRPALALSIFRWPTDHESFVRTALWRSSGIVWDPTLPDELLQGLHKTLWEPTAAEGRDAAKSWVAEL